MKIYALSLLLALAAVSLPASIRADSAEPAVLIPVPEARQYRVPEAQKYLVPAAQLMRVDEGVFELEVGKTIDLTDRKILLGVQCDKRNNRCHIYLNGDTVNWSGPGSRINLKKDRDTKDFVEDKEVCFLDVIEYALPKGAKGIFTFRLHCL